MAIARWAIASFPIAGSPPEIVVAPAAAVVLSAAAPRVAVGARVTAPAGALALSAATPRVSVGAKVTAPAGALALSAPTPRVATGTKVTAPAASVALSAATPRVAVGKRVAAPPAATVALTASAPRLATGTRISAPAAALLLTSAVPRVSVGAKVTAPAASLALTGAAPVVGIQVVAPASSLSLTAAAPRVAVGKKITAPAAQLYLTAAAPSLTVIELTRPDIIYACVLEASARGWGLVDRLPAIGEAAIASAPDIERIYTSRTLYVATTPFATAATDTPADTRFLGRLSSFSLRRSVQNGNGFGGVAEGDGMLEIDNADGRFDERLFQAVAGDTITVKAGTPDTPFTAWRTIFKGTARDQEFTDTVIRLPIRDDTFRLDVPVQTALYAGSGGAEGGDAIANKPKPLLFGRRHNIEPVQVSASDLTYQFHDGAVDEVFAVRDRGVPLTLDDDYASYAALVAATIPAGYYATCLAEGFIRLETEPNGQVTLDAATYQTGGVSPLADIVHGILEDYAGITSFDEASFTTMGVAYPGDHGVFVSENDNWTVRETLDRLLIGLSAHLGCRRDGRFKLSRVRAPTGEALRVFGLRDIIGDVPHERLPSGLSPPPWRMRLYYAANNTVQTDLAGAADQLYRQPGKVAVAADSNVQLDYALAQDPAPVDSGMIDGTEAGSEVARQLAIFKEIRPLRRATLPRNALNAEIGDIVDLAYDRLGGQRRGVNVEDSIAVGDGLDRVELLIYG